MKLLKNYLYSLTYQIVVIVAPLITTPYISRILEVDGIGKYSVSGAVVNYFVLFGMLGMSTYGNRQIAYVRDDEKVLEKTFWELNIIRFVTMGISIALYYGYVIFFVAESNRLLYEIQIFTLLASLVDISWFFSGIEDFKKTAVRNLLVKILGIVLIFTLVKKKSDLCLYAFIMAGTTFIGQCVLWKEALGRFSFIKPSIKSMLVHLKNTLFLWIPSIAINVYTSLDKVMLGYLTNDIQAGLYENSQKLVKMVTTITTTVSMVTLPRMSNIFKSNNKELFSSYIEKSFSIVSFIAIPMTFGIMGIRETIVPWFFGEGFEGISNLLIISAWLVITLSWSSVFGNQVLISCHMEKKFTKAVTIAALVNVIMNCILIKRFMAAGAIIASVMAEYIGMFIMAYYIRKIINVGKLLKKTIKYFIIAAFMYILVYYSGKFVTSMWISTCIQIVIGIVFYFSILWILKDENIAYIISVRKVVVAKVLNKFDGSKRKSN